MAQNETLAARVRTVLAHLPDVEEKIIFRGTAFMVNGKLLASTSNDEIMLRLDPGQHETLLQRPGVRPMERHGRPYQGWLYVNEAAVKSQTAFDAWIALALEFNPNAKALGKAKKQP